MRRHFAGLRLRVVDLFAGAAALAFGAAFDAAFGLSAAFALAAGTSVIAVLTACLN
jgi:hypothetical protein